MRPKSLRDLPIDSKELMRHKNELEEFIEKYSENHLEIKMIINGYEMILEDENKVVLEPIYLTKVFPHGKDDKMDIGIKKMGLLESLVAYIFDGHKNYVMRFSSGSGTVFPIHRIDDFEGYESQILISGDGIIDDWKSKKELLYKYSNYFLENENYAIPVQWYGRAVTVKDFTCSFLHFYRCLEVQAKPHTERVSSPELLKFLEKNDVKKETALKWRDHRNALTHGELGDLAFIVDRALKREFENLHKTTRRILNERINGYFRYDES